MVKNIITNIARKKMASSRAVTGSIAKIKYIALGSGGVDSDGNVISPNADRNELYNEVLRKEYTAVNKVSDISYEYEISLNTNELLGIYISEIALIDEEGDVVAFSNFLAKGKDETEVIFTIQDNY